MAAARGMAEPVVSTAGGPARSRREARPPREALVAVLRTEGSSFDFVQVIRLLQRLYPERAPLG